MSQPDAIDRYVPKLSERGRRWVRFLAVLASAVVLIWIAVILRRVFTPIVAALAIAYILNPLVTMLEERYQVRRLVSVCVGLGVLVIVGLALFGLGTVQVVQIATDAPDYVRRAVQWVEDNAPAVLSPESADELDSTPFSRKGTVRLSGAAQLEKLAVEHVISMTRSIITYVSALATNVFYWATVTVLLPVYTFVFLWRFNETVTTVRKHLPSAYRDTIIEIVRTIDEAISSFFRGRLLVCLALGVITGVGWLFVSLGGYPVPYNLALGFLVGLANLIPFLSLVVLPPVLLLTYVEAQHVGANWAVAITLVVAVYLVAQAVEAFVLTPTIQAKTSGLHPVTNVVALLIGAEVAGFLGLLLAIPIASTLKSLANEYLMPEIRRLAGIEPAAESPTPAPPVKNPPAPPENHA